MLVIACPCALVISTPITYVCSMARAAQLGILVKGGKHLGTLAQVTVIGLDKTGTLTEGVFQMTQMETLPSSSRSHDEVLALVGALETKSSHPMAAALVAAAMRQQLHITENVTEFQSLAGEGVSGRVDHMLVEVGNNRLAERHGWADLHEEAH